MATLLLALLLISVLRNLNAGYVPCNRCVVAMNRDAMAELNLRRVAQGADQIQLGTADMLRKAKLRAKMMCRGKTVTSPNRLGCRAVIVRVEMSTAKYQNRNPAIQCVDEILEPMRDLEQGVVGVHYARQKGLVCCYWIFARDAKFEDNESCTDV